jgi:DivIVA domain-containing protein
MKDEAFHLSPLDIRRFDFGSALRGYDKARVDEFRDQVAAEVEYLHKQCVELETKAKGFHEQLRAFRERDKALNEALISAQQLRGEIREQADREAKLILREATAEGEKLIEQARAQVRSVQAELDALLRTRRAFLVQLRAVAQRQLAELDAAEGAFPMPPSPGPSNPPPAASAPAPAPAKAASAAPAPAKAAPAAPAKPAPAPSAPADPEVEPPDAALWINDLVKKD